MKCINCGHENPEKALLCYWCGLDPVTGEQPYPALSFPQGGATVERTMPAVTLPPVIEVPAPMPVPSVQVDADVMDTIYLTIPDLPPIEIAPPPGIPDQTTFAAVRHRARHRPTIRATLGPSVFTRPLLPGWGRLLVFVAGLGILFVLGSALVAAVGAASFGSAFCLLGLAGLAVALWVGFSLARVSRRVIEQTGAVYNRLEVLGRALREVAPGAVQELPVNLPRQLGVLDQPLAYSELRSLADREGRPVMETAVDLLIGTIASLVGRDDVVLARRTYPVDTRGMLAQPSRVEVNHPVLTRRRAYVGPGELDDRIAKTLRTDQAMTIEALLLSLLGPDRSRRAQQVVAWVEHALSENPPDLEALSSPDDALAEMERFREALLRTDPELYELLETEIRRELGTVVQRSVPSSLLDLARNASTSSGRSRGSKTGSGPRKRG